MAFKGYRVIILMLAQYLSVKYRQEKWRTAVTTKPAHVFFAVQQAFDHVIEALRIKNPGAVVFVVAVLAFEEEQAQEVGVFKGFRYQ